jgi:RNA polymerase sigma factor FliA
MALISQNLDEVFWRAAMEFEAVAAVKQNAAIRDGAAGGYPPSGAGVPVLTAEQEKVLLGHLPTVRWVARRIHERLPKHVELEDLVSAGVVGMMDALGKFDPAKKASFRSYAQIRIRGAILDSLRTLDWGPRELRRRARAIQEAIRILTARRGQPPSESEIAAEMGVSLNDYQLLLRDLKGLEIGTLNMERTEDAGDEEVAYIPGRPEDDPLFLFLKDELDDRLAEAIAKLPDRLRVLMTLYYYEDLNMREIGLALGVVESRVSQIHSQALVLLRARLKHLAKRCIMQRGLPAMRSAYPRHPSRASVNGSPPIGAA